MVGGVALMVSNEMIGAARWVRQVNSRRSAPTPTSRVTISVA